MCGNNIKRPIHSSKAPAAAGPYSHAYQAGDFLYMSGQIGLDPNTGDLVDGGVEAQLKQALENLGNVLHAAGLDFAHVIKTMVFLTDMADFTKANAIYADVFPSNPPARSCVQVAALPKGALVEIEAVAYDDHSNYFMGVPHTHADGTTHVHADDAHDHHHS